MLRCSCCRVQFDYAHRAVDLRDVLKVHTGLLWRVSLVHRGNLILDCRDFNESGVEQCFPDSTSNPQPCTPASSTQTYPPLKQVRCLVQTPLAEKPSELKAAVCPALVCPARVLPLLLPKWS